MPRISSLLAAAPVVDVPTGVNGDADGPGDNDGDDTADADEVDYAEASSVSAWYPPSNMADMSQVGLSSDSWEESKRLGPSTVPVLRWTAPASGFRPLHRDPCLHAAIKKLNKDNNPLYDLAFSSLNSSLAATHATSYAAAFIRKFVRNLSSSSPIRPWCRSAWKLNAISTDVLLPLCDVSRSLAGDPAAQVTSSLNLAVMLLVSLQRPVPAQGYPKQMRDTAVPASSTSSSKDLKGKSYGRFPKGKGMRPEVTVW